MTNLQLVENACDDEIDERINAVGVMIKARVSWKDDSAGASQSPEEGGEEVLLSARKMVNKGAEGLLRSR